MKDNLRKKPPTSFRPSIRSRHHTHDILRGKLPLLPVRAVVRFGSLTATEEVFKKGQPVVEINTVESVANSANKLLMKQCFMRNDVRTADWYVCEDGKFKLQKGVDQAEVVSVKKLPYPILAKAIFGSRGTGNYKIDTEEDLLTFIKKVDKKISDYIFEKFYNYAREYRIHVTQTDYFYTCRKMLKRDAPKDKAWQRHDDNCVWFLEENPGFDKPTCWDEIVENCKRAIVAVGLDVASFDVRVQSAKKDGKDRKNCEFIIIECNSASSFGNITPDKPTVVATKYLEVLPGLILDKAEKNGLLKKQ